MGKRINSYLFIIVFVFILLLLSISNVLHVEAYTPGVVHLNVTLLNQDPYPAEPNNYVNLVFKIENRADRIARDTLVKLIPEYPFSLDPGVDAVQDIGTIKILQSGEKVVFVKYKVRVDKDAIDGENEIKLHYTCNTEGTWDSYIEKEFNITVEDPKTDFDIAIQDYSSKTNTLSLAVLNIGDEDANSVTIILPEQTSIEILGSNKNIVGGIDADDYTVASFKITSNEDAPLIVKITYTDSIGIRREVEKAVMFKASTYDLETDKDASRDYRALIYIVIGVIGIIVIIILLRILKKRRKK